ncbi:Kelch repeat-containing protein [Fodinibius sediminis]|uniref:N-acetylneuraminic acid mutarotase n=1 Tax=Fodinibius sediminis TaxID=1214077 RepID=A0A521BYL7_9BACT|nr:kelch repeat-containing protein [Fodinibius sediminis]SMO51590.1 N-acetylneuraminic acid mutarotase [Fodinibius sediminis]
MKRHTRQIIFFATALLLCLSARSLVAQQAGPGWQMIDLEVPPSERHENAAAIVDGKLYLLGGRGERPVEVYDPDTRQWSEKATPPLSMHHFQAVSYDGKIYVIGAFNGNYPYEDPINHVWIYDTQKDQWTRGPEIPEDRRRGAAGAVAYKGKIYVVGGIQNGHATGHVRWMDAFDPRTGEWSQLADAPRNRDHFQAAIVDGKLYAAGGRRSSQATNQNFELTIPEVDVYDFSTNRWQPLPPSGDLPTERAGSSSIPVGNYVLVLGGESAAQTDAHAEVEALNTQTGQWHTLPPLNQGRHGTQAVILDNEIHVAAGSRVRGAEEIQSQERWTIPDSLQSN